MRLVYYQNFILKNIGNLLIAMDVIGILNISKLSVRQSGGSALI